MKQDPVQIDKLIPGGQALGTLPNGKKAFFWNALPGETVTEYQITKEKSHYLEAIATKIKNPSKHRIAPVDECYLSTSPWQIMDYDYELEWKSQLAEAPIFDDGNALHYRNKMEYSLYWDNEKCQISLAFHARGSHRKIPITQSSIERPEIFAAATKIVADLNANHEEARKYQSLLLRCDQQGNVSGGLFENGQPHPVFPNLTDTILWHKYSYSPNGFFQINLPVYEMALKEIQKHIKTDKVLDLYSGVGTIGLSVAQGKNLTLVESNPDAFRELEKNCLNVTNNCSSPAFGGYDREAGSEPHNDGSEEPVGEGLLLVVSDVPRAVFAKSEDALEYISPDATVIVDPPRAGCDKKLLDKLLEVLPPVIIYLSCNPATQTRDIEILSQQYHVTDAKAFNFFPRTPHIEKLVVLER